MHYCTVTYNQSICCSTMLSGLISSMHGLLAASPLPPWTAGAPGIRMFSSVTGSSAFFSSKTPHKRFCRKITFPFRTDRQRWTRHATTHHFDMRSFRFGGLVNIIACISVFSHSHDYRVTRRLGSITGSSSSPPTTRISHPPS